MELNARTKVFCVISCLIHMYTGLASAGFHGTTYSLNRKNTCSKEATPCYGYMLTLVKDGVSNKKSESTKIMTHHEKAGRSKEQVIMEGQVATTWLKNKYSIDFTNVPDEAYLDGAQAVANSDGTLTFRPYIVTASAHQRLISASRRDKAEFFNFPISEAGWMVKVNEDYTATGEFNGVLPKGAAIFYGDYVLTMCKAGPGPSDNYLLYHSLYRRPCLFQFHRATLVIHFESNTFSRYDSNDVSVIDLVVKENTLGVGVALGVCFWALDNKVDCRSVLTFPASV